jgi:hypothetical protein
MKNSIKLLPVLLGLLMFNSCEKEEIVHETQWKTLTYNTVSNDNEVDASDNHNLEITEDSFKVFGFNPEEVREDFYVFSVQFVVQDKEAIDIRLVNSQGEIIKEVTGQDYLMAFSTYLIDDNFLCDEFTFEYKTNSKNQIFETRVDLQLWKKEFRGSLNYSIRNQNLNY